MTVTIYRSSDASAPVLSGATGTLTALLQACLVVGYGSKAAAGWTRPYNDAPNDTAAFLQGAGAGMYLRVDDGGPGAGTFKEARAVGYETMSDVNAGVSPFPTVSQSADGVFIRKSTTADATARSWILAATSKAFLLFTFTGDTASTASTFSFGNFKSHKPADAYACRISGRSSENAVIGTGESVVALADTLSTITSGNYVVRSYTGIGGSTALGNSSDYWGAPQPVAGGAGGITYPSPVDGGLLMTPVGIHEVSQHRGTIPGLWNSLHNNVFGAADTVAGVGGLSGKTFEVILVPSGQVLLETSNTWDE